MPSNKWNQARMRAGGALKGGHVYALGCAKDEVEAIVFSSIQKHLRRRDRSEAAKARIQAAKKAAITLPHLTFMDGPDPD